MLSPKWTATMDAAVADSRSTAYDQNIQAELRDYTLRLGSTPGFNAPPFKLIKALILIESGGPTAAAWRARVAQIGNPGDPGYPVLQNGAEGSALVMSQDFQDALASKPISDPVLNLRAAIALIFAKAVQISAVSIVNPADPILYQHVVRQGDTFGRIARAEGSTVPDIRSSNPRMGVTLHPKDKVAFHHASMQTQITGWATIDAAFLANRYNGGGDLAYLEKLNYVVGLLK